MNDQVRFLQLGVSFTLGILFHILYIQVNVPAVIFKSMCLSFYCCLFFFFHPFLYPQKVALAQFPELSSSERDLGVFRNQQAVSCSAKSSAEIQPFTTDRHSGETHRHHQTRLELVRKHILVHTNSYTVTHFPNNPHDCSSRHVPLLKN